MKTVLKSLALTLVLLAFSNVSMAQEALKKVEFTSMTRGHNEKLTVSADETISEVNGDYANDETPSKYWKHLKKQVAGLDLATIEGLKSPTSKRQFDGAKASEITIYTDKGKYYHSFDDENPNEALAEIMKCLAKLRGEIRD